MMSRHNNTTIPINDSHEKTTYIMKRSILWERQPLKQERNYTKLKIKNYNKGTQDTATLKNNIQTRNNKLKRQQNERGK